jgi:transcriptional regulator with XRE-family HTH domain
VRVVQWLSELGERGRQILESPEIFFGRHVKQLREVNGWSQRELAARLHDAAGIKLDASAITRIEGGRSVTLRQAVALAYTLGAESLDLMLDEPQDFDPEALLLELRRGAAELEGRARDLRWQAEVSDQLLETRQTQIQELEANLQAGRDEQARESESQDE